MKPLIQKLPLHPDHSFVAKTFRTPHFEVGWHQHIEYELILFTEGAGLSFIGNHVGEFDTGDVYLLGSNLPHTFQKHIPDLITSAVVVQFPDSFWGHDLTNIPETRAIRKLLDDSQQGLKMHDSLARQLAPLLQALEYASGFRRILQLGECLHRMAEERDYFAVSTQDIKVYNAREAACIDRVIRFTIDSFRERINLSQVAAIACMSVPAFCNYFKRSTKKTYIDFLNEVRIGYASTQLLETQNSVLDICYDSGYNTMANFHKQFLRLRRVTPLQYRKQFRNKLSLPQNNIGIVDQ
ncbi:MAG: AraC family transcriptional regulator [Sphingobacteriales bacterium 50-39]|nr:helix-turn-helix domain-containing protein [Sphingobacteriales bacterium]OJW55860.1 MAG: AraC family transcriptional regulator [Sphingobacteriales bacterium 50-39]